MAALTKPAIESIAPEKDARLLLNEFLKSYFDGKTHTTSQGDIAFPECKLLFNAALPKDDTVPLLHVVFADMKPLGRHERPGQIQFNTEAMFQLMVRVRNRGESFEQCDQLCGKVADLCRLLFSSPGERGALSQKGILRPRVLRGPKPTPFPGWQVRSMTIGATLRYALAL